MMLRHVARQLWRRLFRFLGEGEEPTAGALEWIGRSGDGFGERADGDLDRPARQLDVCRRADELVLIDNRVKADRLHDYTPISSTKPPSGGTGSSVGSR